MTPQLWLVGYGAWPAAKRALGLVEALRRRGVTRLVDVRHSPCSSDPTEGKSYGPKPWNLQVGRKGLAGLLEAEEIGYEWLVELGNPQRRDPSMAILRSHLADRRDRWPVHRGLERLATLVRQPGQVVAILCACGDWRNCHRTLVARALADRFFKDSLVLRDVRTGEPIPASPIMEP
jgi:uncharacterized protein (DUF488 family)